jgi:exodeoxyribonuclease VII small subunit
MTSKTSFESLIKKLETIVDDLEEGDLPLEKALRRYEEGMKLSRQCNEILDASEKRIAILTETEEGAISETPVDTVDEL